MKAVGSTLFFAGSTSSTGYELWKTNGSFLTTRLVRDINPGVNGSNPWTFANYKNQLFLGADSGTKGNERWKSNGSYPGTRMLKGIDQ
jgi:ELWxxDGT repeat protein